MCELAERTVETQCIYCGKQFIAETVCTSDGSIVGNCIPKSCPQCKIIRNDKLRTCRNCGKEYRKKTDSGFTYYCSLECRHAADHQSQRRSEERRERPNHVCKNCGVGFTGRKSATCKSCRFPDGTARFDLKCQDCGHEFSGKRKVALCKTCARAKVGRQRRLAIATGTPRSIAGANSNRCGAVNELLFDVACISHGWTPYSPVMEKNEAVDRIIERDGRLERVQVKGLPVQGNDEQYADRLSLNRYRDKLAGKINIFAVVDAASGVLWMLPWAEVQSNKDGMFHPEKWMDYAYQLSVTSDNPKNSLRSASDIAIGVISIGTEQQVSS